MAAARLWLVRRALPPTAGNKALTGIACVVAITSLTRLHVVGDPIITAIFGVVLMLCGAVITRRGWLLLIIATDLVGWSTIALYAEWSPAWFRGAVGLIASAILAVFLQRVRVQSITREFDSKRTLERALAHAREAKRAEREARRAAEHASREKSQFLAHISHEIRTPLNAVLGMTELLLDTELDDGQKEYAETVRDAGEGMLALVNDLLDLAKIEAGRLLLEDIPVDLDEIVRSVLALLTQPARAKALELVVSVDEEIPRALRGDPGRLRQILINLLNNAIKFTTRGEVGIHVRLLDTGDRSSTIRLAVHDTGIGIPPERKERLFEPYVQADSTTSRNFGGTGLGLAIVRRLVEQMGGTIGVESTPGEGSTFWFTLQLSHCAVEAPTDPLSRENGQRIAPAGGTTILVAEDNPINRRLLEILLARLGYRIVAVTNGREAVDAARAVDYAAILMDIQMPELDGLSATRAIREHETTTGRRTPIIACTANAQPNERERCISAGMDSYLTKPLRVEVLARELDAQISSRRVDPANVELDR